MKIRTMLYLILALVISLASAQPVSAQRGVAAFPADGEFNKFPVLKKGERLTKEQIVDMGLRLEKLKDTVTVLNWYPMAGTDNLGRLEAETLLPGTFVYKDEHGVIRYKEDCSNRLQKLENCSNCLAIIAALRADSIAKAIKTSAVALAPAKSSWFPDWFWAILKGLNGAIVILAIVGVGLMILFLIGLLLGWILREALRWFERVTARPTTPAPRPVVPAPVVAPVVPVHMPAPHEIHLIYPDGTRIVMESRRRW
jgi:hypothetical protein